ncbi:hypothetical protein [Yersinia enterocolitica]|uniref:hypothetical protein n=1 Tax=Yersinia enterocolitica TaxID=630 RepID=UPI0030D43679
MNSNNDNRQSILSGDRSERSSGSDNQYAEKRFETERSGPEDFGLLGLESTGRPADFGNKKG